MQRAPDALPLPGELDWGWKVKQIDTKIIKLPLRWALK